MIAKEQNSGRQTPSNSLGRDSAQRPEITFTELWLILVERKLLIGSILALSIAFGLYSAFSKPRLYEYATVIEIGRTGALNMGGEMLEDPNNLDSRIKQAYVPIVYKSLSKTHGGLYSGIPQFDIVTTSAKSGIVRISTIGSQEEEEYLKKFLDQITSLIKNDHARWLKLSKNDIYIKKRELLNKIEAIKDEIGMIGSRKERILKKEQLLKEQITRLTNLIEENIKNRKRALKEDSSIAHATTLLMIDNDIQENNQRLEELKRELYVGLAEERDQLDNALAEKTREIGYLKDKIEEMELRLGAIQNTYALIEPDRVIVPVGPHRKMILAVNLAIGLVLGVFLAFFSEFLVRTKQGRQ